MNTHELPDELGDTAKRLRTERPEIDAHGLDRVRTRILGRAQHTARRSRRSLAITLCLTLGFAFTGTGTGLAVSGLASDGAATQAQYVKGTQTTSTIGEPGDSGNRGTGASSDDQVVAASGSGKLPFTGSASLIILAAGAVLLVSGAVMRRRFSQGADT